MALAITRTIPGTTVDTLTLSTEQAEYVRELIHQDRLAGGARVKVNGTTPTVLPVGDRIRVHLMDFRAMPSEWAGQFDRVVSVEMVEAIGKDMFDVCDSCFTAWSVSGVCAVLTLFGSGTTGLLTGP